MVLQSTSFVRTAALDIAESPPHTKCLCIMIQSEPQQMFHSELADIIQSSMRAVKELNASAGCK